MPDDEDGLTTILIHAKSGEFMESNYKIRPVKNDPQAVGSAITYARRYALSSVLGLNVDDDDDVSNDYVIKIIEAITTHDVDAIGIRGIYTENGVRPEPFETSLKHGWSKQGNRYLRYCNHISPIKREYAKQIKFPDKVFGEDYDWTMELKKSGLLKSDYVIPTPLYFYKFRSKK